MEQSKERPVFTEHPPMSKIIRAEATKFPVLDQSQPKSAKKLYESSLKMNKMLLEAVKKAQPARSMTRYVTPARRALETVK